MSTIDQSPLNAVPTQMIENELFRRLIRHSLALEPVQWMQLCKLAERLERSAPNPAHHFHASAAVSSAIERALSTAQQGVRHA